MSQSDPQSLVSPITYGIVIGIVQTLSPLAFWWLGQQQVWAVALVVIAPVYIGLAVADGRRTVVVAEILVASAFIILALVAMTVSPWLIVIGLVGHGLKDLWQHRTHFVANTRWWPPFCMVVDAVAAVLTAGLLLGGVDLQSLFR